MSIFGNSNVLKKKRIGGYIAGASIQASDEAIKMIDDDETKLDIDYNRYNTKIITLAYVSISMMEYLDKHTNLNDVELTRISEELQRGIFKELNSNDSFNKYLDQANNAMSDIDEMISISEPFYAKMLTTIYDEIIVFDDNKYDSDLEFDKYQSFAEEIHSIIAGLINLSIMIISQKEIK